MRILLFYFSGTGNTRWVARTFKTQMEERSHRVDLMSIEKPDPSFLQNPAEWDIVGLAHPVYAASMPSIVTRFLSENPEVRKRIRLVITTFGYVDGFGYFASRKSINPRIRWYFTIRMFNNVTTPAIKGRILDTTKRRARKEAIERRIMEKTERLCRRAESGSAAGPSAEPGRLGRGHVEGIGPWLAAGAIIRRISWKRVRNHYLSLGVDGTRCIRCLRCVLGCPSSAIGENNGAFRFLPSCTACMRCYNTCPANAITVDGAYADPVRFPRYPGPWGNEFTVIGDRNSDYPNPIRLKKGMEVELGGSYGGEEGWENWVECAIPGNKGWAPIQIFERTGGTRAIVTEDYDATELAVRAGDLFIMEREMNGWAFGYIEPETDRKGWVPKDNLRKQR